MSSRSASQQHGEFTIGMPDADDDADYKLPNKKASYSGSSRSGRLSLAEVPAKLASGALLLLTVLAFMSLTTVPPAHIAVVTTFGSVSADVLSSGLHLTNPFARTSVFSTKTQLFEQQNHVPTKEGLTVDLDVAVLFHVDPARVREIYLSLGPDYRKVIIEPELSSAVRGLTSEEDAKALYTAGRTEMQRKLKTELQSVLEPRGLVLEDVLLKAVTLPKLLSHSIELKAQAEQDSARMEFVLTKEQQEASRKAVEAGGIAEFQRIVSEGISPQLLQWKGIEQGSAGRGVKGVFGPLGGLAGAP